MIKTIHISAKVSDRLCLNGFDEQNEYVGEYDGYVPDFFPEQHYGDYIDFEIDVQTGTILNWNAPTQEELLSLFKEEEKSNMV